MHFPINRRLLHNALTSVWIFIDVVSDNVVNLADGIRQYLIHCISKQIRSISPRGTSLTHKTKLKI
jgi:hypothetical protein